MQITAYQYVNINTDVCICIYHVLVNISFNVFSQKDILKFPIYSPNLNHFVEIKEQTSQFGTICQGCLHDYGITSRPPMALYLSSPHTLASFPVISCPTPAPGPFKAPRNLLVISQIYHTLSHLHALLTPFSLLVMPFVSFSSF